MGGIRGFWLLWRFVAGEGCGAWRFCGGSFRVFWGLGAPERKGLGVFVQGVLCFGWFGRVALVSVRAGLAPRAPLLLVGGWRCARG